MMSVFPKARLGSRRGAVALVTTILLGGLIIEIGLVGLFLFYLLNFTNLSIRLSTEALVAAQSGIQEGTLRLLRERCIASTPINIAVGSASASVVVSVGDCITAPVVSGIITSTGTRLGKNRKLEATVEVNNQTGAVKLLQLKEIGT